MSESTRGAGTAIACPVAEPSPHRPSDGVGKLLLSVLDQTSDAILVLNESASFIFANAAFRSAFPALADGLIAGTPYAEILEHAFASGVWQAPNGNRSGMARAWVDRLCAGELDADVNGHGGAAIHIRGERLYGNNLAVYHAFGRPAAADHTDGSSETVPLGDVIAFMNQGVLTIGPEDTFQQSNERVAEILEIPPELVDPGVPRRAMVDYRAERGDYRQLGFTDSDQVMRAFAPGNKSTMDITTPSGRIVRTDSNPLPDGGSVITYTDVTRLHEHAVAADQHRHDLEQREAALLELARQLENANRDNRALLSSFEAIIENIDYGVVFMDQDLRAEIVNRAWREMWGYDPEIAAGHHTMRELMEHNRYNNIYDVEDEDWETYVEGRVEAVRRGSVAPMEIHRRDGMILSYQCVALADGRRMLTYFDITDIKRQELESRQNAEALQVILNNVKQGLTWFDAELKLRSLNPKFLELLDFPKSGFETGDPFEKFIRFNVERGEYGSGDVEKMVRERVEIARRFEPHAFERERGDGTTLRIEGFPVSEGGFVTVYTDVTEQLRHQRALEEEKERAKAASHAKSAFLANMSHEIRTPLNSIIGMAELFQTTELDDRQRRFAETIVASSTSLLEIINDILDFSKIEAGELSFAPAPFDLKTAVEDVATLLSSQTAGKSVDVMVRFKPGTPQHIYADSGRVRQVITNLVGNAVKFTEAGHVLIDVAGEPAGELADLTLSVVDTGIGIPADRQESIFGAFQQVDASSTRRHGGTGLGLAISKRIVEKLGGRMGIHSELGRGSTFWFKVKLPLAEAPEQTGPEARPPLADLPVLVVDVNSINQLILEEQLTSWGMRPTPVKSGQRALAALEEACEHGEGFGLMILGHQMPEIDGMALICDIKASDRFAQLPIIVLTPIGKSDDWNRLRDLGVAGLLEKPARSALLLETIHDAVCGPTPPLAEPAPLVRVVEACALWTVLVAEDNEMNRRLIEHMLYGTDYRPVFAENGELAVQIYEKISPDLVLMDISMPRMDGYEATARIRALQEAGGVRVPIIGVTAHAFEEDRQRCLRSGMDDHLPKPLGMEALNAALKHWIDDRQDRERAG